MIYFQRTLYFFKWNFLGGSRDAIRPGHPSREPSCYERASSISDIHSRSYISRRYNGVLNNLFYIKKKIIKRFKK